MSILAALWEAELSGCRAVEELSPLADVPRLVVWGSHDIKALAAMRNEVVEVDWCDSLGDLSGLVGGRVGRLELGYVHSVEDVSAIGAMRPPPRTVILERIEKVQDVSMLAGIHMLKVSNCPRLDKTATLAALEGKVGTILWQ